jgi:membrane protein
MTQESVRPTKSTAELVKDLSESVSRLVRDEMQLAAAEMRTKGKQVGAGAGLFGAAGVLAWYGGAALIATGILALTLVMAAWLAALIVGVGLFLIAGIAALAGRKQLRNAAPPIPEQAVRGLKQDAETVKEGMHR